MHPYEPPEPAPPSQTPLLVALAAIVVGALAVVAFLLWTSRIWRAEPAFTEVLPSTTAAPTTTTTLAPATTLPLPPTKVLVANASGVVGRAARVTSRLKVAGFETLRPVEGVSPRRKVSTAFYTPGFEGPAGVVAQQLELAAVAPWPDPPLVGDIGDANVIVVLGRAG